MKFCLDVKERFPNFFTSKRVLEVGAQNVNGSMRDEFNDCIYTGIDAVEGDGVDKVCLGHEYTAMDDSFDVVFSCEMFEHDPHAFDTVRNMCRMLRPGGLFFMTCAGLGRGEHGTTKTNPNEVWGPNPDFYRNVEVGQFLQWVGFGSLHLSHGISRNYWSDLHIRYNNGPRDLYFYGIKA